jgi:tetratricopeptide (TPR) repeat protein
LKFIENGLAIAADYTWLQVMHVHALTLLKRFERALEVAQQNVVSYPNDPYMHIQLSYVQISLERFVQAKQAASLALELDPNLGEAHYALALAQQANAEAFDAEDSVREALRLDPENQQAKQLLSEILWKTGRRKEARTLLLSVVANDPKDKEARLTLILSEIGYFPLMLVVWFAIWIWGSYTVLYRFGTRQVPAITEQFGVKFQIYKTIPREVDLLSWFVMGLLCIAVLFIGYELLRQIHYWFTPQKMKPLLLRKRLTELALAVVLLVPLAFLVGAVAAFVTGVSVWTRRESWLGLNNYRANAPSELIGSTDDADSKPDQALR